AGAGYVRPYNTFGPLAHKGLVGSFVNPNHLAGFLGFASLATLALGLEVARHLRWLVVGGAVLMGAGVVLSLSRGGTATYAVCLGLGAVALWLGHPRGGRRAPRWAWLLTPVAVAGLAGAVAFPQIQA